MGYWQPQNFNLVRERINDSYYAFNISNNEIASITHTGSGMLVLGTFIMDNAGGGDLTLTCKRDGTFLREDVTGSALLHNWNSMAWYGYTNNTHPWKYWVVGSPIDRYVSQIFYPNGLKFNTSLEIIMWAAGAGFANVSCVLELITEGDNIAVSYDAP